VYGVSLKGDKTWFLKPPTSNNFDDPIQKGPTSSSIFPNELGAQSLKLTISK